MAKARALDKTKTAAFQLKTILISKLFVELKKERSDGVDAAEVPKPVETLVAA